jgi:hypothetical protein
VKYLAIAIVIGLAYFGYSHFHSDAKPSLSDVEPKLAAYLATGKGNCTVAHLSDISLGDFSEQFGGWPVYASHEETCQDGNTSVTFSGLDHAEKKVAAAFARRGAAGEIELFVPQFFQDAQQQMQNAVDTAMPK